MSTKKTTKTNQQEVSAYSRLSISKKRMTIVISVPCAEQSNALIVDNFYDQAEKVAEYIETHELEALV